MKRIKSVNGYTIYQAATQRDAENHNVQIGDYNIYLSSDIRDFGLSCSYPEWDGVDSLAVAVAMCNGSKHAVAVELAEELSNSTIQDMDLVLEIERRLDAGEALETIRRCYDTEEQCFVPEADQYCAVDQETGVPAYTWASSPAEAAANVFAGHDWRMIDLYMVHPVADMFLGEFARPEANDEPDEDLLDGDLEDVLDHALETGDRPDDEINFDEDDVYDHEVAAPDEDATGVYLRDLYEIAPQAHIFIVTRADVYDLRVTSRREYTGGKEDGDKFVWRVTPTSYPMYKNVLEVEII